MLDFYLGSVRLGHVQSSKLFCLRTVSVKVLCHLDFHQSIEKMCVDPALVVFTIHRVPGNEMSCSGFSGKFFSYILARDSVQVFSARRLTPVKRQKIDDGPVLHELASIINFNWLSGMARRQVFKVEYDYRRYCGFRAGHEVHQLTLQSMLLTLLMI